MVCTNLVATPETAVTSCLILLDNEGAVHLATSASPRARSNDPARPVPEQLLEWTSCSDRVV